MDPIDIFRVLDATRKLKTKTSAGHDEIYTKLLKETIHKICGPLTHIINQSLHTGTVPLQMKIAKGVPMYKASDPPFLINYRPIRHYSIF